MKHKETFFAIVLLCIFALFVFGCSTKKEIHKENTNEWHFKGYNSANDENIMEYTIDTSKLCETQILVESVEYFNDADSVTHEQRVKSITRKTISRKKADTGQTEIKTSERHETEMAVAADSVQIAKEQQNVERQTSPKAIFKCGWFWLIIIAAFILLYIRYRFL